MNSAMGLKQRDRKKLFNLLTDSFEECELCTALSLAGDRNARKLEREDDREQMIVAVFSDGLEIAWQSECLGPYSDVTPDLNWSPPTMWIRRVIEEC